MAFFVVVIGSWAQAGAPASLTFDGAPLNVVHRDVSPSNILVSYDGSVKVTDFGVARARDNSSVSQVGVIKGKPGYMAPEYLQSGVADRRADIFALRANGDYEANPTKARYDEVIRRRTATNVLLGLALTAAGAGTLLFVYTDFRGRAGSDGWQAWLGARGTF